MSTTVCESPPCVPTTDRGRRVLLIAYSFPPVGGAGVQRPVKWVKYLQRAGWDVTVVTPANPSVPVVDESLLREVSAETTVIRPKTWEPDYRVKQQLGSASPSSAQTWFEPRRWAKSMVRSLAKLGLQPDPQILWYPNAVAAATQALKSTPHDAIICTAPPYSSFLIGRRLKLRFGLPLILDYRDEWDLSSQYLEHAQRDGWSSLIQQRQQTLVLRSADAVVATTQSSIRRLQQRLDDLRHGAQTACIYNGYDAEDFEDFEAPGPEARDDDDRFRLVYTGTLWNLTDVAPLVTAIEQLGAASPALAKRLELVVVGRKTPQQQALLERVRGTDCRIIDRSYCDHSEVLQTLNSADALCLLLSDVPGAERVVPAKLFEYLAARRPLLAIAPPGETSTLVESFHPGSRFSPSDTGGICRWLAERLSGIPTATSSCQFEEISRFSREQQTGELIGLLESLVSLRETGRISP